MIFHKELSFFSFSKIASNANSPAGSGDALFHGSLSVFLPSLSVAPGGPALAAVSSRPKRGWMGQIKGPSATVTGAQWQSHYKSSEKAANPQQGCSAPVFPAAGGPLEGKTVLLLSDAGQGGPPWAPPWAPPQHPGPGGIRLLAPYLPAAPRSYRRAGSSQP